MTPEFALMGHPNEGKSSILSTLSEDDSVRISPIPGETTRCTSFPVMVDGKEILRFTDTPGFQHPSRMLHELKKLTASPQQNLSLLAKNFQKDPSMSHDYELLQPLVRDAGVIYVVDGSRPVRQVDKTEMEILRLLGRPRMAIINCKNSDTYLQDWKNEFRKSFNSFRVFNAHKASYAERLHLLQALCTIDQDWQVELRYAIEVLEKDWEARTAACIQTITSFLETAISYTFSEKLREEEKQQQEKVFTRYTNTINDLEEIAHQKIRKLYKHNLYNYKIPPQSLLHEDVFTSKNWKALGMSRKQVLIAGSVGGAALGAGADIATAGLSFGVFTLAGSLGGAVSAFWGGNTIAKKGASIAGIKLADQEIHIGPAKDIHLLFVLLNRSLLFYRHTINWAHGRRDYNEASHGALTTLNENFTHNLSAAEVTTCHNYFQNIRGKNDKNREQNREDFALIVENLLQSFYK